MNREALEAAVWAAIPRADRTTFEGQRWIRHLSIMTPVPGAFVALADLSQAELLSKLPPAGREAFEREQKINAARALGGAS